MPVGLLGGLRRRCAIGNCSASFGYSADSGDAMTFETDPRDFAMELVEENRVTAELLLTACLKYMNHQDVRDMLDSNELSPRFLDAQQS